jgi:hypothetical protein
MVKPTKDQFELALVSVILVSSPSAEPNAASENHSLAENCS